MSPGEIERTIDAVTAQDVMRFAQNKIWDQDIAISAVGAIEDLFDYARIRGSMSRMFS